MSHRNSSIILKNKLNMATTIMKSVPNSKTKGNSTSKSNGLGSNTSNNLTSNIDSTIESIEQHIKNKTPLGVTTSISNWTKALGGNMDLKEIAFDLEDLKEDLSKKWKENR